MSSLRKSCLPSVGPPGCAPGAATVAEVMGWIMRGLLSASRPHVEPVAGDRRESGGATDDGRRRGGYAVGRRRECRRVVARELTPGRVEPEMHAHVAGDEALLRERFAQARQRVRQELPGRRVLGMDLQV